MIDHNTVQQIIDAADIVDVVSDFVALKHRGANWIGLCPFHNDRRPSFYVSRAKGICKCFACGEGGSAVNFIMKHEQLSYPEALRYLAKKYHIEIHEKELTDEEKQAQSEREAMLMLNEWACAYFEQQLHETQTGQDIGLSYFKQRGFNDATIRTFRLGYSQEGRDDLYRAAVAQGFNPQLLFDVGLCIPDEHGGHDRFRGRVMFPIMNLAGKVIAFGGRTLRKEKDIAKYVNSPESTIYYKRDAIYGLYQAKRDISKLDSCFIVEGYADVISMHQAGFTNVIASSGTALTTGHIHAIRRFTENVTEMFDGDEAGIKAAIRGVDLLLREGMKLKVLPLPLEDDPDTFVRAHSHTEVEDYIKQNEQDFISFKSGIVLKDAKNDPIKRTTAITDVVKSIALIPDEIARMVYGKDCSTLFDMDEKAILRQIKHYRNQYLEQRDKERKQERERQQRQQQRQEGGGPNEQFETPPPPSLDIPTVVSTPKTSISESSAANSVEVQEREVIKLIINHGMCYLCETPIDEHGNTRHTTVLEYVRNELALDQMSFSNQLYARTFEHALACLQDYYDEFEQLKQQINQQLPQEIEQEMAADDDIDPDALDSAALITAHERKLKEVTARVTLQGQQQLQQFSGDYLQRVLCSIDDDEVRQLACDMATENLPQLSKIHSQFAVIVDDRDRLYTLVPERIFNWKNALLLLKINELKAQIAKAEPAQQLTLIKQLQQLYDTRHALAVVIGDRVVNPK